MKKVLRLKRFSQEIDFDSTDTVHYFLVFADLSGKEFRLPSTKEQVESLTMILYGEAQQETASDQDEDHQEQEKTAAPQMDPDDEVNQDLPGILDPAFRDDPEVNQELQNASQFGGNFAVDDEEPTDTEPPFYGRDDDSPESEDEVPAL